MRIFISGSETFSESNVKKMVDIFKKTNGNRHLDLQNMLFLISLCLNELKVFDRLIIIIPF